VGPGYTVGPVSLIALLILVLFLGKQSEKTIAVEEIRTTKAEVFYWLAFLTANTLGTAAGDLLADQLGIGFLVSALIISVILVGLVLLHFFTQASRVILFWFAFVLTRPFGATLGDLLTKPVDHGGLNLGTVGSCVFFLAVLVLARIFHEFRRERFRNATRVKL